MVRAGDIMTGRVVTVEMDDTLATIKEIFDNLKFHHLLVVDNGALAGIISDRDLLKALSPNLGKLSETVRDTQTLKIKAHQVMSRNPFTLPPEASLTETAGALRTRNISCVPIIDRESAPDRIVPGRDLMKALLKNR